MCHTLLTDSKFYQFLFRIDQEIATEVQVGGCCFCGGGVLHSACYPRKPRGFRSALDEHDNYRLSFCCAAEGCRRRTTPPSVRFLGRKVYMGVIVVLISALEHGLSPQRRGQLIDALNVPEQTLWRWQRWWQEMFGEGPWWRMQRAGFVPPCWLADYPASCSDAWTGRIFANGWCGYCG